MQQNSRMTMEGAQGDVRSTGHGVKANNVQLVGEEKQKDCMD